MHPDLPDAGQRDRAWATVVADPDRRRSALVCLLRSRNDAMCAGLLLEPREPDPLAFALAAIANPTTLSGPFPGPRRLPRTPADTPRSATPSRSPPSRQHLGVNGEQPAGGLGFLPRVEGVDQIKPRPRQLDTGVGLASVRAIFTIRRHWLNANRDAPACRANTSCCSTVGSRQKRNVVCRDVTDHGCTGHRQTSPAAICSDCSPKSTVV